MYIYCLFLQVDKHIRRLDSDLARFEAEIQEKAAASSARSVEETTGNKSKSMKIFCFIRVTSSIVYFP
jgi:hypothetical protein